MSQFDVYIYDMTVLSSIYKLKGAYPLAAGDTFRAGVVYGILQGKNDRDVVSFASACAGVACTRFPSVHEPPTLAEIEALMNA